MLRPLLASFITCQLIFATWPGLDIWISGLFYSDDQGFWLAKNIYLEHIRNFIKLVIGLGFFGAIYGIIQSFFSGGEHRVRLRRVYEVVVLTYVLGPGILVNAILKNHWGRARPADIEAFGGSKMFTPPFQITDQCATNCSFVSGEGSAVTTLFFGVCLAAWVGSYGNLREAKYGRIAMIIFGTIAFVGLALRVLTGRHFMSDTLFAVLLMGLLYVGLLHLPRYKFLLPQNGISKC